MFKKIFFLSLSLGLSFCNPSEASPSMMIFGVKIASPTGFVVIPQTFYYVAPNELRDKSIWDPAQEFPLNLAREGQRTALFVAKRDDIESNLDLGSISIKSCELADNQADSDTTNSTPWRNKRWFLFFTFQNHNPDFWKHASAVELLDGTYAEERKVPPGTSDKLADSFKTPGESVRAKSNSDLQPFLQQLDSPDFEIPSIQWDPVSQECPVSVTNFLHTAAMALKQKYPDCTNQMELEEVDLNGFLPGPAIIKHNLDLGANLHHWLFGAMFSTHDGAHEFEVWMLLDGRILQTVRDGKVDSTDSP